MVEEKKTEIKKAYKIVHDRDICIGCSACASVCPKYWEMEDDGKSSIIGHEKTGNGEEEVLGSNEEALTQDYEGNLDAAESCPVNCIHIFEIDKNKEEKKIL
ncbi:ferredoxin [Candidatus Woesearchaeota archaeon]|nr:ferredoxin [Candidatus Woesearchaeota archaeon]USN44045.1 MAG: ferredoxin [Candidatus Woesearchaeota archaeon]